MIQNDNQSNWVTVKMFEGEPNQFGTIPAVELTCMETNGGHLIFSYTPIMISEDDDKRPVSHLRGDLMGEYMRLFEESSRMTQKVRANWNPEDRRGQLAASIFDIASEGDRRRSRSNGNGNRRYQR